ncbi:DUF4834 family protein [Galbibacter sp. EGI 63066]|uniref:DUF4834 family protein n=1 Tax=Galbibacter sp. EGI 63066 TaxID=2993559 RepID=UPI00224939F8|nr:DUF4834 family protein [Galbibacter sp. EGI 63066]MCX2681431.1 DUF4834 family protein [Galbibacter sp. EGI 63066]
MQLLRTILIILLVYYGIKILSRLFGPYLMKYASKKMEKKFSEKFGQQYQKQQEPVYKEGETVIDKKPGNSQNEKSSEKVGEYIEFEEID